MKSLRWVSLLISILVSMPGFAQLVVTDPTVRLLPPGVPTTSAYFTLTNNGDSDRFLVAAAVDFAEAAELHAHLMHDGMMKMQQQQEVKIPAGQSVKFAPGGLHVMIFGLSKPLQQHQQVTITLYTKDDQKITVEATVVKPGQESASHHH